MNTRKYHGNLCPASGVILPMLVAGDGRIIAAFKTEISEQDGNHIVDCVNACDGLPAKKLKNGWSAVELMDYTSDLEKQRDKLLNELREVLAFAFIEQSALREQEIKSIERLVQETNEAKNRYCQEQCVAL